MSQQVYRNDTELYAEDNNILANFTSRAWIQLAGQLELSGTGIFLPNTLISGVTLSRNTWYKVKLGVVSAPEFVGQVSADYTLKVFSGWTFDATTGNLTCNIPGNYTIVYNMAIRRTTTPGDITLFCAIGGNDNPPNQSFAGGGGSGDANWISLAGTCIDTVNNPGDTRALWARFQGTNSTETIEIGALNLDFTPILKF